MGSGSAHMLCPLSLVPATSVTRAIDFNIFLYYLLPRFQHHGKLRHLIDFCQSNQKNPYFKCPFMKLSSFIWCNLVSFDIYAKRHLFRRKVWTYFGVSFKRSFTHHRLSPPACRPVRITITISPGSYSACFGSLMAFEQALVTPSEQTQQRWAKEKKGTSDDPFIIWSLWARSAVIPGGPSREQDECSCSGPCKREWCSSQPQTNHSAAVM